MFSTSSPAADVLVSLTEKIENLYVPCETFGLKFRRVSPRTVPRFVFHAHSPPVYRDAHFFQGYEV